MVNMRMCVGGQGVRMQCGDWPVVTHHVAGGKACNSEYSTGVQFARCLEERQYGRVSMNSM